MVSVFNLCLDWVTDSVVAVVSLPVVTLCVPLRVCGWTPYGPLSFEHGVPGLAASRVDFSLNTDDSTSLRQPAGQCRITRGCLCVQIHSVGCVRCSLSVSSEKRCPRTGGGDQPARSPCRRKDRAPVSTLCSAHALPQIVRICRFLYWLLLR